MFLTAACRQDCCTKLAVAPSCRHSCRGYFRVGIWLTGISMLLQRFVDAAILAYECGMNEDSLRYELHIYKESLEQAVAPPGMVSVSLACLMTDSNWPHIKVPVRITGQQKCQVNFTFSSCRLQALNEDGCMLAAKIVWITLMEARSVRRWATCEC